mgnify:FL=1
MYNDMEIILESTGALVYIIDLATYEILYANNISKEEFGDVIGKTCYKVLQKNQDSPCGFCPLQQENINPLLLPIGTVYSWENENSINHKHYLFTDRIIEWGDKRKVKIQVGIDITKQKQLELQLLKEKNDFIDSFEILINSTIEGLIIYDENKYCIKTNSVAPKLLGYSKEEMIGKYALDFIAPSSQEFVKRVIQNHNQEMYEAEMIRKDGSTFPVILRGRDLILLDKKIRVSAIIDASDIKAKEKEILQLAQYDSLTKLPNRLLLKELLSAMIKRVNRDKAYGALLFIDLDHFKLINDTKGHDIGDIVLVETAKRIKNCIRQIDIASRLGGDEFVVALEIEENDEDKVIDSMTIVANKILEEIKKPYLIHNFDFRLTASIGIMLFKDSNHKIDELMKFADTAMYNAKEKGRNRYSYFDPKLQAILEQKADLAKHLREAIDKKMIFLNYQLQVISENEEDKVVGVEALVRWNDPKKGIIGPNLFIPIAEETGLIIPLGNWILKEVMIQLKQWEEDEIKKDWRISVNVSYRQFEQDNFVHKLKSLIEKYKINPSKLRLEITENLLIKDTQNIINKISELSLIGVTISIDDFGTGYSSLAYLKQLSIDELKIDQSFIKDILTDSNDLVIVETMLSIGKKFNLEIIAEGVETKEQYEKLVSMGCSYFQGYFFGKPVNPNLLEIKNTKPN